MGLVLHGSAKTTPAIRAESQRSEASASQPAKQFWINEKTVLKWRKRPSVEDPTRFQTETLPALSKIQQYRISQVAVTDRRA